MPDLVPSPLADHHEELGARVGPFAGWLMPISYEGTLAEHAAVREGVGVFDVSHLGTVWVRGQGATAAVDGALTNDPRPLVDGESQYTLCATEDGGVVDDLIVYRVDEQQWMAVPNAANTAAVVGRLVDVAAGVGSPVTVEDQSRAWAVLAVQGPRAFDVVAELLSFDPSSLAFGQHTAIDVEGEGTLLCRTGYTGERGVELVLPSSSAASMWMRVLAAGVTPCGLAARDTLRLEMGYPLHGNELSVDVSPYEARLGWAVRSDGRRFVGRDALVAARQRGPARRLWGLVGDGRRPPRAGMAVTVDGARRGTVTSGSFSPTLGVGVGLALLDAEVGAGATAVVDVRGTDLPFTTVRPPMVERDPR